MGDIIQKSFYFAILILPSQRKDDIYISQQRRVDMNKQQRAEHAARKAADDRGKKKGRFRDTLKGVVKRKPPKPNRRNKK